MLGPSFAILILYIPPVLAEGPAYCRTANGEEEYWVYRYLTTFNNQRKILLHGWQMDSYGELPPAKSMNELMWGCALEQEAQDLLAKQDCDLITGRKEGLEEPNRGYVYFFTDPLPIFRATDSNAFSSISDQFVTYVNGNEPLKQWANTWNCTLEKEAHEFLKSCPTEGYQRPDDNSPAQNFYRQTITASEPTFTLMYRKTVTEWWKPVRKVSGPGTSLYFRLEHNSTAIRSFTLMAWASSSQMGCSIAKCGNEWVAACRYHPPGNKVDEQMYRKGRACSECSTFGRGPCDFDTGLCL